MILTQHTNGDLSMTGTCTAKDFKEKKCFVCGEPMTKDQETTILKTDEWDLQEKVHTECKDQYIKDSLEWR